MERREGNEGDDGYGEENGESDSKENAKERRR